MTERRRTEDAWRDDDRRDVRDRVYDSRLGGPESVDPAADRHGLPDPDRLPPVEDPTGAEWWHVLTVATAIAVAGFFLWPFLDPLLGLTDPYEGTPVGTAGGVVALAGVFLLAAVRFVVLPVALWRDATLLSEADVGWEPSRRFYLLAGAFWASLTCAYYLYKRSRYTGRPSLPVPRERLYFEGRRVPSNWHLVVLAGATASPLLTGMEFLWDALETVPYTESVQVVLAMVVAFVAGLAFLVLPVAYYRDTRAVRRADVDWNPNTALYVVFGYVFGVLVAAYYIYRRTQVDDL